MLTEDEDNAAGRTANWEYAGALKDFAHEEQRRHSAFHLLPNSVQKLLFMA